MAGATSDLGRPAPGFSFSGDDEVPVANLINHVQAISFAQGRERDGIWQADYATTCLLDDFSPSPALQSKLLKALFRLDLILGEYFEA
ncbi:hypothetical protein FRB98_002852 [Tulasnella sp. 332]|nr:hypothetical protein FRB98_002852 [Tulasnella sp. 332]